MFLINSIMICRRSAFLRIRRSGSCALALKAVCAVLCAFHYGPAAHATGIEWGTSSPATETYLQSDGISDFDTSWNFELGYFSSITPTATNTAAWKDDWTLFDAATYTEVVAGTGVNWFSSTASITASQTSSSPDANPSDTFTFGAQAYVWIHDTKIAGTGVEWLLYTNDSTDGSSADDWTWPVNGGASPGTLNWRTENASAVVFGALSPDRGGGGYSVPDSSYTLQTHTLPVPEPTSALLLAVAGGFMVLRRRRRNVASTC